MRSSQHNNNNKRSRGRSRRHSGGGSSGGGSGGGNPINRVYESNGPEVKVRGTAQTVADKYLQLGRDAQASGDNVMAENFYQHAEHYLRILAAAQAYNQQYQSQQQQYRRPGDETFDDEEGDEGDAAEGNEMQTQPGERPPPYAQEQPSPPVNEPGDQPSSEGERRDGNQSTQSRSRDYGRSRDRYRSNSNWDNRREGEDRVRQPQPRTEPAAPAVEASERPAPQPLETKEGWDGPQPSFLKRSANGSSSSRTRSEKKPRRESAETSDAQDGKPASAAEETSGVE